MASQSQGYSQDSTIEDQRFAELLKPIKDLTQNWEVPLAEILSGYMDELQQVTITFDGGQTSVNFAQAALVLQGTASVYSKKVDFLWQMVLKTTELLRNKSENENSAEDGGDGPSNAGKGRKKQVDMTKEFELLTTDIGKNIDLKTDEEETINDRKNALNFIYITPRQLIEKEGSEQKSVKVNLYMGVANSKWDLLAAKEDFRINGQYVAQTGYLGEELNVDNEYLNLVHEETIGGSNTTISAPQIDQVVPDGEIDPMDNDVDMSHGGDGGVDDLGHDDDGNVSVMSERAAGQNISSHERDQVVSPPPVEAVSFDKQTDVDVTPEPVFDPWAPLDPSQQLSTPKPINVKKTIKIPPSLKKNYKPKPLPPISDYLSQEMSNASQRHNMFPFLPPCFSDLANEEYERRKERDKQERRERLLKRQGLKRDIFHEDDDDNDDHGDDVEYDNVGDDACDDNDVNADDNDAPNDIDDLDLPNPHIGGDIGAFVAADVNPYNDDDLEDGQDNESLSYEEMVARKVEEFVTQSQEYMRSSELAMKVAKWHEMIGPRLETVEKRNAFDIHAYGSRVLNNFNPQRTEVSFDSVVRGQKGEEVSRYFLSMLMLANTENVQISTFEGSDPQLGMDNVMIKLLSTARHHQQLQEFQPLSQAGDDTNVENDEILADVSKRGEKRNAQFKEPASPLPKKGSKKKR